MADLATLEMGPRGLDRHYAGVSPQLLARVRANWSAQGLDLDAIWRDTVPRLPGFSEICHLPRFADSRPVDLLLLFDQGCCWIETQRQIASHLSEVPDSRLTAAQRIGWASITTRLIDGLAAVRSLAIAGLAMPAMQIARSISEDVDLGLALLVRRKLAEGFVSCRGPEEAADFWRRHLAGGRAFRLVAQALYHHGLDYSDDSDYVRWRKEVLVFLGSAVHSSFQGTATVDRAGASRGLNPTAQECLYFATIRVQEMCAYTLVLGTDLRHDLARLSPGPGLPGLRLRFARAAGDIILDQMRWLTATRDPDLGPPLH